jgi:predicted nucleic acid-binding protein
MNPRVYLETSVISYLTARPSRDLITAAHQSITRRWWDEQRQKFDIYVSGLVLNESARGDEGAAQLRNDALIGIPVLSITPTARDLADRLVAQRVIPREAVEDSLHVAVAAASGMDYLLTWNCRHIANALLRSRITACCEDLGMKAPIICTPEELLGDSA